MRFLYATAGGLLSAVAAAALYLAVQLGWNVLYVGLVLAPRAEAASGGWSWDASSPQSFNLVGPLAIGFVVGVWWTMRR